MKLTVFRMTAVSGTIAPATGGTVARGRTSESFHVGDDQLTDVLDEASVRRIRDLLQDRDDAIVTIADPDGHFLWVSEPGSLGMFGRRPDEVDGTRFDYMHPEDRSRARHQQRLAMHGATVRYTVRGMAADGGWRTVTSVAWTVGGPWGTAIVVITTPAD